MCGISGIVNRENDVDKDIIHSMNTQQFHRGPDAGDIWVDRNVGLGHRRLSIIDLSNSANQPFKDPTGNYIIVFNGEIYNFESIRNILKDKYTFNTNSDTEVVLNSFIEWGEDCLHHFNGMFAIAIWNIAKKELFIARDRLGIKPFYYAITSNEFIFASELRTILSSNLVEKKLDNKGLAEYLAYQTVIEPNTIIRGIKQLEAGKYGFLRKNELLLSTYWKLDENFKKYEGQSITTVKKEIKSLFYKAVEERMISDVPLGAFLSGGIDSSAIVGAMAKISSSPISTFSIGFEEKEFDESSYAKIIADKYKTNHHNIRLSATEFVRQIPSIIPSFDTPSGDGANTYIVSSLVKKRGIKVALSGLGGDELFAGYESFKRFHRLNRFKFLWNLPTNFRLGAAKLVQSRFSTFQFERLRELLLERKCNIANIHPYSRRFLSKPTIDILLNNNNNDDDRYRDRINQYNTKVLDTLSQVSIGEICGYTENVLLRDTDQMSMAHALEVRVPFFDHNLVEYVLGVPDKLKYPNYQKQLLVESISPLLPNEIVHRKKMGFAFPWEEWLRTELNDFCKESIRYLSQLEQFDGTQLNLLWDRFMKKDPSVRWSHVWVLVMLGSWIKENNIS